MFRLASLRHVVGRRPPVNLHAIKQRSLLQKAWLVTQAHPCVFFSTLNNTDEEKKADPEVKIELDEKYQ